jgi:ureidoacrylate peracid hydrolase
MLRTLEEKVDPKHAALVVIDVQNFFCHEDGAPGNRTRDMSPIHTMVPRLVELVEAARAAGVLVIYTQAIHSEADISPAQRESWLRIIHSDDPTAVHCRDGSWEADFYKVAPLTGEPRVKKHRASAFIRTDFDLILRSNGIQTLILTGLSSDGCVESTARDGFMYDYYIVAVDDCMASLRAARHESAIINIASLCGIVCSSEEIKQVWSRVPVTVPAD